MVKNQNKLANRTIYTAFYQSMKAGFDDIEGSVSGTDDEEEVDEEKKTEASAEEDKSEDEDKEDR